MADGAETWADAEVPVLPPRTEVRMPQEEWDDIITFWRKQEEPVRQTLRDSLTTIGRLSRGKPVVIGYDGAPYSFVWSTNGWVGGCIFHGAHDNGGDGSYPTLAVHVTGVHGWSIHT